MKKSLVGLVAAAAIIAACSSETTTTPPVVASVEVRPAADSAETGDSMLLLRVAHYAAVLKDAGGHVLSIIQVGQSVTWTSSAPTVASVTSAGVVTGVTPGTATITAAVESKNATSNVKVNAVAVATVSVTPTPDTVAVGKTVTLTAWPLNASGDTLTARKMIWVSSDTSIATVSNADSLGVVPGHTAKISGVKAGAATITATIAGVSGTGALVVKP